MVITHSHNMKVTKRDGSKQDVSLDKVTFRIKNLCDGLDIDPIVVSTKVCSQIFDGVTTSQLDELAAEICIARLTEHPDYGELATRIIISNNHKNTSPSFSETIETLYRNVDKSGNSAPLINRRIYNIVMKHKSKLNSVIDYKRDYDFDYFAFKTLEKSYLIKVGGKIVERIQHAIMRVSLGMYFNDIAGALKCYEYFSQKYFTHASPTWYHSGMNKPNFLSCFLLGTDDSIGGIYKTIGDCAKISKGAGGIGVHISNIRSRNSYIRGTNGKSSGIIPMLKVYNETAKHVNQSGKRPGAFAMYLEPHHPDILDFLELKKNHGDEDERARDLFLALWVSDLFMERVRDGEMWSLMDPDECKGLQEAYGDKYRELYLKYESEGKYVRQVKAADIWSNALKSQIETGVPYILYKDASNIKSNQQNIGTIKSSNLCAEILEYSDAEEYACCCLASICLPRFVDMKTRKFDHEKLIEVCKVVVRNLNNIVDLNAYPVPETKLSNEKNRPLGVGVQGLADVYQLMRLPFDSDEAKGVNIEIFETLYYGCLKASYEISKDRNGAIYEMLNVGEYSYKGGDDNVTFVDESYEEIFPDGLSVKTYERALWMYKVKMFDIVDDDELVRVGKYYQDLKGLTVRQLEAIVEMKELGEDAITYEKGDRYVKCKGIYNFLEPVMVSETKRDYGYLGSYINFEGSPLSEGKFQFDMWGTKPTDRYNWDELREGIMKFGVRNSLLTALMPTASTSQIMGNNECIEPYTSNIYVRNTLAGAFTVINKHLIRDLVGMGLWSKELKNMIIAQNGSVQGLDIIPAEIQEIYKTAWELKQKVLIDQAADRGSYICQTQSMNLFFVEPPVKVLHSAQMYGWKRGLKTGSYYIRSMPKSQAQQVTIDPTLIARMKSGTSVSSIDSRVSEIGYVSPASSEPIADIGASGEKIEMTEAEKERVEREKEVEKVMGRACSIFNPSCEACSS